MMTYHRLKVDQKGGRPCVIIRRTEGPMWNLKYVELNVLNPE